MINFDIRPFIADIMDFKFTLLNLDLEKMIILYILLSISFGIIYISHQNANERLKKKNILALLSYFLVYYVIVSFVIVVMFFEVLIEKKHKWRF